MLLCIKPFVLCVVCTCSVIHVLHNIMFVHNIILCLYIILCVHVPCVCLCVYACV